MRRSFVAFFAALLLFGCRDSRHTSSVGGHQLSARLVELVGGRLDLVVTISNGAGTTLIQDMARGAEYPPNIVRVYGAPILGQERELPLTASGTNACLRGELWADGHYTSRPIKLAPGEGTNWIYRLNNLFVGISNGTYRVEFVPSAIDGFGQTNWGGRYFPFRTDLAASNLYITIR